MTDDRLMFLQHTCEDCLYRVDKFCRRHPPTDMESYEVFAYPVVMEAFGADAEDDEEVIYMDACGDFELRNVVSEASAQAGGQACECSGEGVCSKACERCDVPKELRPRVSPFVGSEEA